MRQATEEYKANKKIFVSKKRHNEEKELKVDSYNKFQKLIGKNMSFTPYFRVDRGMNASKTEKAEN